MLSQCADPPDLDKLVFSTADYAVSIRCDCQAVDLGVVTRKGEDRSARLHIPQLDGLIPGGCDDELMIKLLRSL